jgi:hypothetical protein
MSDQFEWDVANLSSSQEWPAIAPKKVRTRTRLHPHRARRQIRDELLEPTPPQCLLEQRLTPFVRPVHVNDALAQVHPDYANLIHGPLRLRQMWVCTEHLGSLEAVGAGRTIPSRRFIRDSFATAKIRSKQRPYAT